VSRILHLVVLASTLALSACGGSEGSEAERLAELEKELSTLDVGPGIGEPGPPPRLTAGWETDFDKRAVPLTEFRSGGPGKDGIPAVDDPQVAPVAEIDFLEEREPVVAVELGDEARAYPIQILIWHEIVNDELGGVPVAVTFCPLCNTAIAFDRRLDGRTLDFGTTGNLRNSDLVMYDRQTQSWWQQFGGDALVGELTGAKLDRVPARIMAWEDFAREHPRGTVLTRDTGHDRPYGQNPYAGYDDADTSPFFPVANGDDDRLPPKERVVFVESGDDAVAVPYSALQERRTIRVELDGRELEVTWREGVRSSLDDVDIDKGRDVGAAEVRENGELVPFEEPFWFAVAAFRPDVRIVR
jgi:hypothetical protein